MKKLMLVLLAVAIVFWGVSYGCTKEKNSFENPKENFVPIPKSAFHLKNPNTSNYDTRVDEGRILQVDCTEENLHRMVGMVFTGSADLSHSPFRDRRNSSDSFRFGVKTPEKFVIVAAEFWIDGDHIQEFIFTVKFQSGKVGYLLVDLKDRAGFTPDGGHVIGVVYQGNWGKGSISGFCELLKEIVKVCK